MRDDSQKRIEKLKSRVYSRDYDDSRSGARTEFSQKEQTGQEDWVSGDKIPELLSRSLVGEEKTRWAKRVFVGSLIFFLMAAGVAVFMFLGGLNTVSSKNVDIEIGAPVGVAAGEVNEYEITINNGNNVTLENVALFITYPDGSRRDTGEELTARERVELDNIASGRSLRHALSFIVYGEKESVQNLFLTLEYTVPGSNATFTKEKQHEIRISSAPLIVEVDYPEEVSSGQLFDIDVTLSSNSTEILEDVVITLEPPFGYSLELSDVEASAQNTWNMGDFKPAQKKTITLNGRLLGQDQDERTFRFVFGRGTPDGMSIQTELVSTAETVRITRPFIVLSNTINGQSGSTVVVSGGRVNRGVLRWQNTTDSALSDVVIEAEIFGLPLDKDSVRVQGGFYQSVRDSIVWDKSTDPRLSFVDVGEEGSLTYNFGTKTGSFTESDGVIQVLLKARGVRVTGSTREVVSSETTQQVKLAANLGISGRAVYSIGPFSNMGPVPPQAEQMTTYTILLNATASFGDITDTKAVMELPLSVEWLGVTNPTSESVTYDDANRRITWNLGVVREGAGSTRPVRELAFQVRLTPSVSQKGGLAVLVDDIEIIGQDDRAGTTVIDTIQNITTSLSTDPQYNQQDGIVE